MKEGITNIGKKEQRQIDHLLSKELERAPREAKEPEARTAPTQHKLKSKKPRRSK